MEKNENCIGDATTNKEIRDCIWPLCRSAAFARPGDGAWRLGPRHHRVNHRHGDRPERSAVSGAAVTVRNVDTNAARTVSTSDIGTYKVTQLQPGSYTVKVDKAGFKVFEQNNITLQIDQVAVINAQLEVGSDQETVKVTSFGPVIQTEDSSVGEVIDM